MLRASHTTRLQDDLYRVMLNQAKEEENGGEGKDDEDEPEPGGG